VVERAAYAAAVGGCGVRRADTGALERKHPRVRGLCSERDWEHLEAMVADGLEPSWSAGTFGRTLTDFRKTDYFRHQRLLQQGREARADVADRDLSEWAHAPDASDTIRVYWHRYTANAAGRGIETQKLELTGRLEHVEDRSASLADIARVLVEAGALDGGEPLELEVADARGAVAASRDGEREASGVPHVGLS
jgi:hypothetical protein